MAPLTERGRRQCELLGHQLRNLPLDVCVVSRFGRTRESAEMALSGRTIPIVAEPLLDDVRIGDLEGLSVDEYRKWKHGRAGHVIVDEQRTLWARVGQRTRVECKSPGATEVARGNYFTNTGPGDRTTFVFMKGGGVSASSGGLKVDTGTGIKSIGCSATEALETHGLPGGPSFTVSPPLKSRFSGSKPFSITCKDEYSHPFTTSEPNGNHHSFTGSASAKVTLTPFPATKLTNIKKALRDSVGQRMSSGQDYGGAKDCLRG